MKPFETVKFMKMQKLSITFADNVGEKPKQTVVWSKTNSTKIITIVEKLFSIFIGWIYKWRNQSNWSTRTTLVCLLKTHSTKNLQL